MVAKFEYTQAEQNWRVPLMDPKSIYKNLESELQAALGSKMNSRRAGTFGRVGCFSFFPTKTLGGFGDAGLLCTDDEELATRLRSLRSHGRSDKHRFSRLGGNFRMDALHAALLSVLLGRVDGWIESRTDVARHYTQTLGGLPGVTTLSNCSGCDSAWNAYTIRVTHHRDALANYLKSAGIETGLYYPVTLADQAIFASERPSTSSLVHARSAAEEVVSLPVYPGIPQQDQALVIQLVQDYFRHVPTCENTDRYRTRHESCY